MAFEARSYSGNAVSTPLTSNISNVDTAIPIDASTGWPDGTGGPFFIKIDSETIKCSGRTGLTLNVQTVPVSGRGWDGTTPATHLINAEVTHVFTATDADEANQHYANTGLDHHSQYLNIARHDLSARHGIANLPVGGTPSNSAVGDTATSGVSNLLPKADHRHGRESFGSPVGAGAITSDGVATTVPRSDHVHAGGIPILSSAPSSPVVDQTYIDSTTHRIMTWNGTAWIRVLPLRDNVRTGVIVGRTTSFNVPDGGAVGTPVPWNIESYDTDNLIVPDGTTTTSITPTVSGFYLITVYGEWGGAVFSGRSFVEILFDGTYNYRVVTTGEGRWTITACILCAGQSIQVAAWQNSGSVQTISFAYMTAIKL